MPKDFKSRVISCTVSNNDFSAQASVSFVSREPLDRVDCEVNAGKDFETIGKVKTCNVKSFQIANANFRNMTINYINGDVQSTDIMAFSSSSLEMSIFPRDLSNIFENLKVLEITDAKITVIDEDDMRPYGFNLQYLDLSSNFIILVGKDLFKHNPNLRYVDLSNNFIFYAHRNIFDHLIKQNTFQYISMHGNECIDASARNGAEMRAILRKIRGKCNNNYINLKMYEMIKKVPTSCSETDVFQFEDMAMLTNVN